MAFRWIRAPRQRASESLRWDPPAGVLTCRPSEDRRCSLTLQRVTSNLPQRWIRARQLTDKSCNLMDGSFGLVRMRDIRFAQVVDSDSFRALWPGKKREECPTTRRICWSLRIGFARLRIAGLSWKVSAGRLVFVAHVVVMLAAGRSVAGDFGSVRDAITRHR